MSDVISNIHSLADQSKIGFAMAFLGSTGLLPEQAVMHYGIVKTPEGNTFKVWYERKGTPESDNAILQADNEQMACMLAYIVDKIGATDETLIQEIDRLVDAANPLQGVTCGCVDKENRCSIAVH